jgi:hypothetical protein
MEIKVGDKVKTNDEYTKIIGGKVKGIVISVSHINEHDIMCKSRRKKRAISRNSNVMKIRTLFGTHDIGEGWLIKV